MVIAMRFRPLGNTGLHLSEVALGGHWPTTCGKRYQDVFPGDEVPSGVAANRHEVVSACLDAGINYIDVTTAAEALAYGQVLGSRRSHFILGADDYQWSARNSACLNVQALTANVERCLTRLRTDYLDLWRVTAEIHGQNTDPELDIIIETADRLRTAGKIRHWGMSSHHAGWLRHAVTRCPALKVVMMPCLPMGMNTCNLPDGSGQEAGEVLAAAIERSLGIIGIKPFAGGLLFSSAHVDGANDPGDLASIALRWLLQQRTGITSVVPGLATVEQVRIAVAAVNAAPLAPDELSYLQKVATAAWRSLPPTYAWLGHWA